VLTLFPDQQDDFAALRTACREHRRVLFQASTGYGKTVMACAIAHGAASLGTRTCFTVHRKELIRQTCKAFERAGIPYGVIAPEWRPNPRAIIQIASVFTLARRKGHEFDLVIEDECHHAAAGQWGAVRAKFPDAAYLGLTATPVRLDGQGMGHYFDHLHCAKPMRWLIEHGRLSPYEYWAPETVDLSGLRSPRAGHDYTVEALERAMASRAITGNVINHYKRICDGQPFLCQCVSVAHAQRVAEDFRAAGYPVEALWGAMPDADRDRVVAGLGRQIVGITFCDLISEGFDVPGVVCVISLRKTKSLGLFLQVMGRGLRVAEGKTKAVLLDCVGNFALHGMPDMERTWALEHGVVATREKAEDETPDIRRCEQCYAVHEWAPSCPYCGYVYEVKEREIKTETGELKQLSPEEIQALEEHARATGRLQDWHAVGKAKGFKAGWAFHRFKQARASASLRKAAV
jgi:DNA repair protein RadD